MPTYADIRGRVRERLIASLGELVTDNDLQTICQNIYFAFMTSLDLWPAHLTTAEIDELVESVDPAADVGGIMSPLYVLYDLRVAYSHLGSDASQQEKLDFVRQRLGLGADADLFSIYDKLVPELSATFGKLTKVLE